MITNVGLILLALWLILTGIATFIPAVGTHPMNVILGVLAMVAGILILVGR